MSHHLIDNAVLDNADKTTEEYRPTYELDGGFVNDEHRGIMQVVEPVEGQLRPEDALKLYELAYFSPGPVLEIGCLFGKSTTILALAIRASGRPTKLISVDVNEEHVERARASVARMVPEVVPEFRLGPSAQLVDRLGCEVGFAFVDGNHTYPHVRADLLAVDKHLLPEGFALLHDYYDSRNQQPPENPRYGVVPAAEEVLGDGYRPAGRFGCCALYQKLESEPTSWVARSWNQLRKAFERKHDAASIR